jgi:hypothetical protein
MQNAINRTIIQRCLNSFGFRFLAGGLACVVLSTWLAAQTPDAKTTAPARSGQDIANSSAPNPDQEEAAKLREESVKLQAGLESTRKEIEGFKWLLTVIFGAGVVYLLAQGMLAYSAVKSYSDQAQQALEKAEGQLTEGRKLLDGFQKEAEKTASASLDKFQAEAKERASEDFGRFRAEIQSHFPMFVGLESRLVYMASQLTGVYDHLSLGKDVYDSQGPIHRQHIEYYERAIAAIEFLDVYRPDDLFQIFRGLCRYYIEKFSHSARGRDRTDLERAEYYLHRSRLLRSDRGFMVSNERGYIALVERERDLAEAQFEESIRQKADQQCAHYNVAAIVFEKVNAATPEGQAKTLLEKAIGHLKFAQGAQNWEDKPHVAKGSKVSYNLACALNRLAERSPESERAPILKEAFDALERSVMEAPAERSAFARDRLAGGDLGLLRDNSFYAAKLDGFAEAISKAQKPSVAI